MTSIFDITPLRLIEATAATLKEYETIKPPSWAKFAKTGIHKENPPEDAENWWFIRCASILRKVYVKGPIGQERLRSLYGGRKNRGPKPDKFVKGSGSIIRKALQQLEEAGLLERTKKGRRITAEGVSLLNKIVTEIVSK
ncbi:MAG: 30S ribosomal protein S19e [Candidatus Hodarchaeota archaeon]